MPARSVGAVLVAAFAGTALAHHHPAAAAVATLQGTVEPAKKKAK